jgi:hypothetical protein
MAPSNSWVRVLVPARTSEGHALAVLAGGFVVEGGTEVYQFLSRGSLGTGSAAIYYLTLVTTVLGFYLMFRGLHEWSLFHPRARNRPPRAVGATGAPSPARPVPWRGLALFGGGAIATAILNVILGGLGRGGSPFVIAWLVGGIVVLAFGSFFLSLERTLRPFADRWGAGMTVVAAVWALGTSVVAGLVIGERSLGLLADFFTNWTALVELIAPIVVAMSPLFVAYGLLTIAYIRVAVSLPSHRTTTTG